MIDIGRAAKYLRERMGLSQRAAATELGMSHVHLSKIENATTSPTAAMLERYYDAWGVDLYMLAVAKFSDSSRIPAQLCDTIAQLQEAWDAEIETVIQRRTTEGKRAGYTKGSISG